jgi:hypothetical protein
MKGKVKIGLVNIVRTAEQELYGGLDTGPTEFNRHFVCQPLRGRNRPRRSAATRNRGGVWATGEGCEVPRQPE